MLSLLGFLIILGPLVIVHELGHYIFARIFGVKAEVFSVGFGPCLWKRQWGETEVRLSAFPLGGYVKLLGEDREAKLSEEEQKRALHRQVPWKRFFIFFGGPLFNFIFAIFVFMTILVIGEPQFSSVVGRVVQYSTAEKIGFRSGDRIVAINGDPVKRFDEVVAAIGEHPSKQMTFEVARSDSSQHVKILATPSSERGYNQYGEATPIGEIDGLLLNARGPQVGVSNPVSMAGKAGFVTGDLIEEVNGTAISNWEEIDRLYQAAPLGTEFRFKVKKTGIKVLKKPQNASKGMGIDWGLHSSELFVEKPVGKSPAEKAGVRTGDRLFQVGKQEVYSFIQLKDAVQKAGETDGTVQLHWEREGKVYSVPIVPTATPVHDPTLKALVQYTVGVMPMFSVAEAETYLERVWNPIMLVYKGTERMVSFSWRNFVSIQKMITGDVSVGTLGGPIMIGKIAGESLTRGLRAFLLTMAILSIGLGVLNILPVPVLDGGHLLLLGIEIIRGKPLTLRTMEIIQLVGLSLILLLMAVVIKNDITRLTYF